MKISLPLETRETTTLKITVQIFNANYHWHNLLLEFAEWQFWNILLYLTPPHFLFFLNFYCDVLLEIHLTELWREVLNGLGKSTAFSPAPHQPPALVWCLRHRSSGGITAGSLVSNCRGGSPPPLVVSSI